MRPFSAAALLLCWTLAPSWPSASSWGRFAVIPPVSNPRSRQNVEAAQELETFLEEQAVPAPDADRYSFGVHMGVAIQGGTPIAGWFIIWEKLKWMIWRYHHQWKPPYVFLAFQSEDSVAISGSPKGLSMFF